MTYDVANDKMIVYGGFTASMYYDNVSFYQDTWAYDYNSNTWTNMSPAVNPPPLGDHEGVYDLESEKHILFGG